MQLEVHIIKPLKNKVVTYHAAVLERTQTYVLLHAQWDADLVDVGYITFAPGDHLYEHFYTDRWYNVYDVRTPAGVRKGWYCNITRPAVLADKIVESEDLELDVFVSPDRQTILVLDEDEYAQRGLATSDPIAHHQALAALAEVQRLATAGAAPFV
jgi:hypothetical protein